MQDKRFAFILANAIPILALALVILSARARAAPLPPATAHEPQTAPRQE